PPAGEPLPDPRPMWLALRASRCGVTFSPLSNLAPTAVCVAAGTHRCAGTLKAQSQQKGVVAMRVVVATCAIVAAVAVCGAAVAQNNTGQPPSSGSAEATEQTDSSAEKVDWGGGAPPGHRQPRVKDVPAERDENAPIRSPEDE